MIRRLGDLLAGPNPAEGAFVQVLLLNMANGNPVTNDTWRIAQKVWEDAVNIQINLGHPNPEVAAMYALTAATTAGADMERFAQQFYPLRPPGQS